jgi:hypothetical protein
LNHRLWVQDLLQKNFASADITFESKELDYKNLGVGGSSGFSVNVFVLVKYERHS